MFVVKRVYFVPLLIIYKYFIWHLHLLNIFYLLTTSLSSILIFRYSIFIFNLQEVSCFHLDFNSEPTFNLKTMSCIPLTFSSEPIFKKISCFPLTFSSEPTFNLHEIICFLSFSAQNQSLILNKKQKNLCFSNFQLVLF